MFEIHLWGILRQDVRLSTQRSLGSACKTLSNGYGSKQSYQRFIEYCFRLSTRVLLGTKLSSVGSGKKNQKIIGGNVYKQITSPCSTIISTLNPQCHHMNQKGSVRGNSDHRCGPSLAQCIEHSDPHHPHPLEPRLVRGLDQCLR